MTAVGGNWIFGPETFTYGPLNWWMRRERRTGRDVWADDGRGECRPHSLR